MAAPIVFTKTLAAAVATNIALSQSPGAAALTLNGAAVSGGIATIDTAAANNTAIGRRVIVTSGGDDTGITWTVVGTNAAGARISDTFAGVNNAAASSSLDFVTVTSITPSAAVATTATAGTNGVGASRWIMLNNALTPMNLAVAIELVTGSANYTLEYTFDDPNLLGANVTAPLAFSDLSPAALIGGSATKDGVLTMPVFAVRLLINSGTGSLRARLLQAGIG